MTSVINWLNTNAGAVQAISTMVLVVITAWYALLTRRLSVAAREQVQIGFEQMKAHRKATEAATASLLANSVNEINRLVFEHPEVYTALDQRSIQQDADNIDRRRYHLMHIVFNVFEHAYHQHEKYALVGEKEWLSWVATLTDILRKPYPRHHWKDMRHQYAPDFCTFVDGLLQSMG